MYITPSYHEREVVDLKDKEKMVGEGNDLDDLMVRAFKAYDCGVFELHAWMTAGYERLQIEEWLC